MNNLLKKIGMGFSSLILTLNIALAKDFKLFPYPAKRISVENGKLTETFWEEYSLQYGNVRDNNYDSFFSKEVYLHPVPQVAEKMKKSLGEKCEEEWFKVYWDIFEISHTECARIEDMPKEVKYVIEKIKGTDLYKDLLVITRFKKDNDLRISFHPKYDKDEKFYEQMVRLLNSKDI